jgi:hypothetical protein
LFRKPKPELDLEDFRNGVGFKVAGLFRRAEDVGRPGTLGNGFLHLEQGQPVVWRGRSGERRLTGPFELHETGGKLPFGGNFTKCLLSTGKGDFELAVPTLDLDLVRLALAAELA